MKEYDRRQLKAMCFVASLAPVTRLLPKATAQIAGSASWLAPLCALPMLLLYLLVLTALMNMRREGEGLGEVVMRRAGRTAGSIGLGLIAVFHLFSAGFILRTGAHRLISTIYPAAGPWFFMATMLLMGTLAALGPVKALPRASRVFAPILLTVMLLALLLSLDSVDVKNLLPVTKTDFGKLFLSSLAVVEISGGVLYCAALLEDRAPLQGRRFASHAGRLALICVLLTFFCAVIIGCYGAGARRTLLASFLLDRARRDAHEDHRAHRGSRCGALGAVRLRHFFASFMLRSSHTAPHFRLHTRKNGRSHARHVKRPFAHSYLCGALCRGRRAYPFK